MKNLVDEIVKNEIEKMNGQSCEFKKVQFRNAITEKADEMAKQYLEQFNSGLITWAELGERLTEVHAFEVETKKAINNL